MNKLTGRLIIISVITTILFFDIYLYFKFEKYQKLGDKFNEIVQLNTLFKQNIVSSFSNNGIKVDENKIAYDIDDKSAKPMEEYLSYPCLVIYIPYSPETCTSCIDYAIGKVKHHFADFENNPNICIISSINNPSIVNRIIKKRIYHFVGNNSKGFGIPADNEPSPQYFIITNNNEINSYFIPNIFYEDLIDKYLSSAEKLISNKKYVTYD